MRVNAGNTDMSRHLAGAVNSSAKNNPNSFVISSSKDSVNVSKMGGRLGTQGNFFIRWDRPITKPGDDPALKLMDKSISSVGRVLEQMRSIAELAQDERLSDLDRMDLQIEMDRLQKQVTVETHRMSLVMAGKSEREISELLEGAESQQENGVLQRARERILKGEKWDVAEKLEPIMELKEVHVITAGERKVFQIQKGESFELPSEIDPKDSVILKIHDWARSEFVVTDDKSEPTVRQQLEMGSNILLMDAKSAEKGRERIEKQLDELLKTREAFAQFYVKNADELQQADQGDGGLSHAEVEELASSANQDRMERESQLSENLSESLNEGQEKKIHSRLGLMVYSNELDPRLVRPQNRTGAMFAKIESLFKDKIARALGLNVPSFLSLEAAVTNEGNRS